MESFIEMFDAWKRRSISLVGSTIQY